MFKKRCHFLYRLTQYIGVGTPLAQASDVPIFPNAAILSNLSRRSLGEGGSEVSMCKQKRFFSYYAPSGK